MQLVRLARAERDRRRSSARSSASVTQNSAIRKHGRCGDSLRAPCSRQAGSLVARSSPRGVQKALRCAVRARDLAPGSAADPPRRRAGVLRHAQGDGAARPPRAGRAAALARGAVRAAVARPGSRARARRAAADAVGGAQGGRRGVGRHRGRQRRAAAGRGSSWTWRVPRAAPTAPASCEARSSVFRGDLLEGFYLRDSPPSTPGRCARPTRCSASSARRWAAGAGAGRGGRVREGDPARAALAGARPAARAGAPRADPPVRARRRPRGGAGAVPRLRADAEPGARRGAGRRDRRAVRAGERGDAGRSGAASPRRAAAAPARRAAGELPLVGRAARARGAAARRTRRARSTGAWS